MYNAYRVWYNYKVSNGHHAQSLWKVKTMNTTTKTGALLAALQSGESMTAKQMRKRFNFASTNSVTSVISQLRAEGFPIFLNTMTNSKGAEVNRYRLATRAPRKVIAAGYALLGADAYTR